jgi:hypothetical protein
MSTFYQTVQANVRSFPRFTQSGSGITLRPYQTEPATAILNSIKNNLGLSFVVIISRQSGKDELAANLKAYLLTRFSGYEMGIVECNPTYKPQTINAIERLEARLSTNLMTRLFWKKRSDFMRMVGKAKVSFLSGDKTANVVGAVASLLLIINEAQDIDPAIYDKKFAPMVASTNATRVFFGTEWTTNTLLHREERNAIEAEKADGIRRLFKYNNDDVRKVVPAYGVFVDNEIKKLGRQHPLIKTQYFCETIDAIAGMFNAGRLALLTAEPLTDSSPQAGHAYAITMDVGGQDEAILELDGLSNPGRDYVTVDIVDIDLSNLSIAQKPTYHVIKRLEWQGVNHVDIFGALIAIMDTWHAQYIVLDATGVGEGLWGMCLKKYPTRTIGFKFTQQSKSEMGYSFLGMIDTGRFRDHCHTETVNEQYTNCNSEILLGPAHTMRWGVKDGTRGADGLLIHDDYILADALISQLDLLDWYIPTQTTIIEAPDVLQGMDNAY